jgi:NitT/TauT family transport system substrate-binding protein/sulfonate transport system substrate-binding protein
MIDRRVLLGFLSGGVAAALISRPAHAEPARVLRVGYQKGEPILLTAKENRSLETLLAPLGIEVQWLPFQFGPPLLEAMRVGSIDIGAVGDTPPIFAQAAHADLVYLSAIVPGTSAIILPAGSTLQAVTDLKGKKVAIAKGSAAQNLAIAALEKAGLAYGDIEPAYLAPADAAAAFERGSVDAWTIWDPYFAIYEQRPGVRVLALSKDIIEQNSFLLGSRGYVTANPQLIAQVIGELGKVAAWAGEHRTEVAKLLSDGTGVPLEAMTRSVGRNPLALRPVSDAVIQTQQRVADRFFKLGLIPAAIRVGDQVWRAPGAS